MATLETNSGPWRSSKVVSLYSARRATSFTVCEVSLGWLTVQIIPLRSCKESKVTLEVIEEEVKSSQLADFIHKLNIPFEEDTKELESILWHRLLIRKDMLSTR